MRNTRLIRLQLGIFLVVFLTAWAPAARVLDVGFRNGSQWDLGFPRRQRGRMSSKPPPQISSAGLTTTKASSSVA